MAPRMGGRWLRCLMVAEIQREERAHSCKRIDKRMANYNAIEMGENDALLQDEHRQRRNLRWQQAAVFISFAVASFCITVTWLEPLFKQSAPLLSTQAHWSKCASFSLAACCDCGDQKNVGYQCYDDANNFMGMTTCKRGCCLPGLVDTCNYIDMLICSGLTAAVFAGTVPAFFLLIGLGPLGPIAGGLFAAQMGAAVLAGSIMAILQSVAMTAAYGASCGFAAGLGGLIGAWNACNGCVQTHGVWQCVKDFAQ